jgi:DNA polymerase III sliding clamp (beta) subunit (PCNA family)
MIQLSKKCLTEAMKGFRAIKVQNNNLEILQMIRISAAGEDAVLEATNLEETLHYRCPLGNGHAGHMDRLVPYDNLREVERHMDAGTSVTVEQDQLRYTAGGLTLTLPYHSPAVEDYPQSPEMQDTSVVVDADSLQALQDAARFSSKDSTRYIMNGVHLTPHHVAATDGRRLYVCNSRDLALPDEGFILPVKPALRLLDSRKDARLHTPPERKHSYAIPSIAIAQGPWIYQTKLIQGTYPDWSPLLDDALKANRTEVHLTEEDAQALMKALPCLKGGDVADAPVLLRIDTHQVTVTGADHDPRTGIALAQSSSTGPAVAISFNRNFLLQALSLGLRRLTVKDALSSLLMQDTTGMRKVLWMPLRGAKSEQKQPVPQVEQPVAPTEQAAPQPEQVAPQPDQPARAAAMEEKQPATEQAATAEDEPDEDPWTQSMEACAGLRDTLRQCLAAVSGLQGGLRKIRQEHTTLQRDSRALRRGIRELQKLEV